MHRTIAIVLAIALSACATRSRVEYRTSPDTERLGLPFSEAVRAGDLLLLSGQIGLDYETGRLVPGGIEPETRKTLDNIRAILERNGSSMDRVVKCTVMLADIADWPKVNSIYVTYFAKPYPARSALGASGLALGAKVEIECIATLPSR